CPFVQGVGGAPSSITPLQLSSRLSHVTSVVPGVLEHAVNWLTPGFVTPAIQVPRTATATGAHFRTPAQLAGGENPHARSAMPLSAMPSQSSSQPLQISGDGTQLPGQM